MKTITLQKNKSIKKLTSYKALSALLISVFSVLVIASVFAIHILILIGSIIVCTGVIYRICKNYYFDSIIPAIDIANYTENMLEITKDLGD